MTLKRARDLRRNPTEPERRLWAILHSFRQQGYHFRRQAQIGPYYADFACLHANLVIEADGVTHTSEADQARDHRRETFLHARGFRVLRLWNTEITDNPDGVFQTIAAALDGIASLAPTPVPSPQGGGRPRNRKLRTGLADLAARTGERAAGRKSAPPAAQAREPEE